MSQRNWKSIKTYEDILLEEWEGIAKVSINRQEVYNAFRPQTVKELLDAFDICRERTDLGVVILTGTGDKAFCSGGDQNVKGIGGYVDENGIPRLNVLDLHKKIRSLHSDSHGEWLCHRRRARIACRLRPNHRS